MKRNESIYVRVTEKEKKHITLNAKKCGLSQSEYLRQRALGYSPKEIPPNAFYIFIDKLNKLCDRNMSAETEAILISLINQIETKFILNDKE